MAARVRRSVGLDSTPAMLDQARRLAAQHGRANSEWILGSVDALPYADKSFDAAICRFTIYHFEHPARAFSEMVRVCRPGKRVVVCHGTASDDPLKAAEFNRMERYRDPSTVGFRTLGFLRGLFLSAGLPAPGATFFQIPMECETLISKSFPEDDTVGCCARSSAPPSTGIEWA